MATVRQLPTARLMPVAPDEPYPDGKQLWFAHCAARGIAQDAAEKVWRDMIPDSPPDWQRAAELFLAARGNPIHST